MAVRLFDAAGLANGWVLVARAKSCEFSSAIWTMSSPKLISAGFGLKSYPSGGMAWATASVNSSEVFQCLAKMSLELLSAANTGNAAKIAPRSVRIRVGICLQTCSIYRKCQKSWIDRGAAAEYFGDTCEAHSIPLCSFLR